MIRVRRCRLRPVLLLALLGLLVLGGTVTPAAARQPVPVPTLTDVSATTRTPALFTVTGLDFTPGGRVYLAIYDQMGDRLYETRWVVASPVVLAVAAGPGHEGVGLDAADHGGTLREGFAGLCGATAMLRALDEGTATWSNWLPVGFACDGSDGPTQRGRPY